MYIHTFSTYFYTSLFRLENSSKFGRTLNGNIMKSYLIITDWCRRNSLNSEYFARVLKSDGNYFDPISVTVDIFVKGFLM